MNYNKKICCGINDNIRCNTEILDDQFYCNEHNKQRNVKDFFVKIVKFLLAENNKTQEMNNRFKKVCEIFDLAVYNKKLVNSMSKDFNKVINDKIIELLNDKFVLNVSERIYKLENYKKYFVWLDTEEIEPYIKTHEYPKLNITTDVIIL
jgi:hypothetical protein